MRKVYLLLIAVFFFVTGSYAQLSGVKAIPGDYANIAAAITDLNAQGVGAGGVTFNVAAGHTETLAGKQTISATGTSANPVIFQKSGGGANPIITSYTGTVATPSTIADGFIVLAGCDYITFDGIDLQEAGANTTTATVMEFGYGLFLASATNGCQNNTIKNCTITLNRLQNTSWTAPGHNGSVGIAVSNGLHTATGAVTVTAATGSNSNNKFYTNTIQNCNAGIAFTGFAATAGVGPSPNPATFFGDLSNDVGGNAGSTGNIIKNFGGAAAAANPAHGVFASNQWGLNVAYNTINNNDGGGVNHVSTLRGVFLNASSTSANVVCNNNNITIRGGATTSQVSFIENSFGSTAAGNTVNINNNTCTGDYLTATSGSFFGLYNTATPATLNMQNNTVNNVVYSAAGLTGTGTVYLIYSTASNATTTKNISGNTVNNINRTGTSGGTTIGIYVSSGTTGMGVNITGNTVSNMAIDGAGTASIMYGIQAATGTINISNNNINNLQCIKTTGTGAMYGIYDISSPVNETYNNNDVHTLVHNGTGIVYGIFANSVAGTRTVAGNLVYDLFTAGTTIAGINMAASSPNVYKNKVYDIESSSTGAPTVSGILLTSTSTSGTANIYNNLVGDLKALSAVTTTTPTIRGINIVGTSTTSNFNISFNSVFLNASSAGANFGTAALYATVSATATSGNLTLKNNIFVNLSTAAGTGFTVAYQRSGVALNNYASASNNNLFYAGTPSASNLIFYDGTNSDQTLSAFKARVTPAEINSIAESPNFLSTLGSSTDFLHINTTIATQIESGGIPVAGITDDFDGQTRNATIPDIGADEFTGIGADLTPPIITYTPLVNACTGGARTLIATITDASGIPTSGAGLPTLYWKINAGAYTSEAATSLGSNQFQFTTLGTGSNFGDIVSYYIAAQDNAGIPNVAVLPSAGASGFTVDPPAASTPPTTPSGYSVLPPLNGTYNVGAGQAYTTLTAAVADYNTKCLSGPVVFNLVDATYPSETYPITINSNPGTSATNTLTIVPDASITAPILFTSAVATTSTIELNGATYVTIDGRPGGTGTNKYIAIENTSSTLAASGNAILLRNEASNNTLTYLDVRSANLNLPANTAITTAGAIPGAIAVGSTSGANGNDNNTISYCDVHSTAAALLGAGIYAGNATTAGNASNNDNNTITNCNVFDFFIAASASAGINIAQGNNNWTITNNSVYQTATLTYTGTQTVRGFWITPNTAALTSASGYTITGNYIGGSGPAGTGMTTMTATTAFLYTAMDISVGLGTATSIQGNFVNKINMTTSSTNTAAMVGINIANGITNTGTVTPNIIGDAAVNTAPYGVTFTTTGTLGGLIGIRASAGGPHVISNNIVAGIELIGNATTVAPSFNGINYSGGSTGTISNNTVGSATLPNSINLSATSATSTSSNSCRGIVANTSALVSTITGNLIANINSNYSGSGAANEVVGIEVATGSATVSGNTIRSLSTNSQGTGSGAASAMQGITIVSTTAPQIVSGNNIYALKLTNPSTTNAIINQGLFFAGPSSGSNLIEKNNIHSISMASPTNSTGILTGMDIGSGTVTIQNNMIRLGLDSSGASITSPCTVRGITKNTAIAKIFHNSIYIGGSGVGTTATNTFAFVRTGTASIDSVMNNIFVNERSNATTGGKHYQVNLNATATLVLNYNVYYGTGTGNVFGFNGTTDVPSFLSGWVATDLNSNSGNPQFINPTGTAVTGDLHINPSVASLAESLGYNGLPVTDDIDTQTRAGLTPVDIGADAGNFTQIAVMVLNSVTTTQSNTTVISTSSTNQQVIGIEVVTSGLVNPLSVTDFTLNTNGTTNVADIVNAKIFFTGSSATFATTTQVGSTIAAPSGAFTITGTQQLTSGTNYFWLTYDIPCGATVSNLVDAECTAVTIGSAQTPTVQAPTGSRTIINGIQAGIISSNPGSYCVTPGTPTLTRTGGTVSSNVQWQESTVSGTGPWTNVGTNSNTYTPGAPIAATTYFRIEVTCNANTAYSNVDTVELFNPQVLTTTPGSRCGIGTVTLSATAFSGNSLKWFAAASGGTALGTGNSFTTPVLSTTTTYYVSAVTGIISQSLGAASINTFPNSGTNSSFTSGMLFDVTGTSVKINSVDIYPTSAIGTRFQIVVRSGGGSGTVIATYQDTTTVSGTVAAPVVQTVPVNFTIPTGTGYAITFFNGTLQPPLSGTGVYPGALRNNPSTGATFPYTFPGLMAITNGTLSNVWYYFYNWQVETACESARTAVTATVTAPPVLSTIADATICNNEGKMLNVTSTLGDYDTYTWAPQAGLFTDNTYSTPYTGQNLSTVYVKTTTGATTNYVVTGTQTGGALCSNTDTVVITVMPATLINGLPANICISGSSALVLNPATGYGTGTIQWQTSATGGVGTYTDISGQTGTSYTTPVINATTWYGVILKDGAGVTCQLNPTIQLTVNNPSITGTTPNSRCGTGTITLGATGSSGTTLNWYSALTGGSLLGTGLSYTTPSISTTTNYYVAAGSGVTNVTVGPNNPTTLGTPSSSNIVIGTQYMLFDVTGSNATISAVDIYPTVAIGSSFSIVIRNSAGTDIFTTGTLTTTVTGGATPQTVVLNAIIPNGTGYRLGMGINPGLQRNTTGASYPYVVPGVLSFTGNSFDPVYWYFFYNVKVQSGCESPRTLVTATVNNAPLTIVNPNTFFISCDSAKLNVPGASDIKITEITLQRNGTGQTTTYPAYAVGEDLIEISNISSSPVDVSGYTFADYANNNATASHPYTIPAATIIPANGVLILHLGTGTDDAPNGYYNTGGTNNLWLANSQAGFVLKNTSGSVVDVVGCGGSAGGSYTFAPATNVTSDDWTGFAPNATGFAGVSRLVTMDNNIGSDWLQSNSPAPIQTMGTYNAGLAYPVYLWTPATGLFTDAALTVPYTNQNLATVYAKPGTTTTYNLQGSANGCTANSNILVNVLPAGSISWTGAVDTDWNNIGNWKCGGIPTLTSEVVIPSGMPRYPLVNLNVEIKKLTVAPGASVTIATGFDFKLNGN